MQEGLRTEARAQLVQACRRTAPVIGLRSRRLVVFLVSALFGKVAMAASPPSTDMVAAGMLQKAVEEASRAAPTMPLETALSRFRLRDPTTSFRSRKAGTESNGIALLPRHRPNGVTPGEWEALRASGIKIDSENGGADFQLLDLDGDGLRDLVVTAYIGGTGLFNETQVLLRKGNRFRNDARRPILYSIGDRGGNQAAVWIRLAGKIYVAYRDGRHGADTLLLLRPDEVQSSVPELTVRYRYTLSLGQEQREVGANATGRRGNSKLRPAAEAALQRAVRLAEQALPEAAEGPCPAPANVEPDREPEYTHYGPGHYTVEAIADVPVWIGRQCHPARLQGWFGRYSAEHGLQAQFCVRDPYREPADEQCFDVKGARSLLRVERRLRQDAGETLAE